MDDPERDLELSGGSDGVSEPPLAPRRVGVRARSLGWVGPALVAVLAALVFGIALPRPGLPVDPSPPVPLHASPSVRVAIASRPTPSAPGLEPGPTEVAREPMTATDAGLTMTVAMDGPVVETGQTLVATVTIENLREQPVVLGLDACGAPASMHALVQAPVEPFGLTWDGPARAFKDVALATGNNGTPVADPRWVYGRPPACHTDRSELTLPAGATIETTIVWTAQLVKGVPAPIGDVPFVVAVSHDPSPPPPALSPGPFRCCVGSWVRSYEQLTVEGTVSITGDPPRIVSAGQAIDAILADARFRAWFGRQAASTWSVANLFLANDGPGGIIPAGPTWEVDLFREVGVPRNWAIAFIDPVGGTVRQLSFCNAPCDR